MVAILHNIRSLHNVGSIFRTADAAGIEKIYLCGVTPTPLDRFGAVRQQLAKVALGAEKTVAWERCPSTSTLIGRLKKDGYTMVGVEQDKKSVPYFQLRTSDIQRKRLALLIGAEVEGLPAGILKKCDKILEIPMHGAKESLNVGVAFGIVVFRLLYK